MYELMLNNHQEFCDIAKAKMKEMDMDIIELSRLTGYTVKTLNRFFQGRSSRFVAASISDALELGKKEEKIEH